MCLKVIQSASQADQVREIPFRSFALRFTIMDRFFLEIAYDGTDFHGWQIQKNSKTIQQAVNKALGILLSDKDVETIGCGRTDTKVHATQFFLQFETKGKLDAEKFLFQLNGIMPQSIAA